MANVALVKIKINVLVNPTPEICKKLGYKGYMISIDMNKPIDERMADFAIKVTCAFDRRDINAVVICNNTADDIIFGDAIGREYNVPVFNHQMEDLVVPHYLKAGMGTATIINASGYDYVAEVPNADAKIMVGLEPFTISGSYYQDVVDEIAKHLNEFILIDHARSAIKGIILDPVAANDQMIVGILKENYGWDIYVVEKPKFLPVKKLV